MDHSLTYTQAKLRNFPHRVRLRKVMSLLKQSRIDGRSWADVGCSNGFIIRRALEDCRPAEVFGFDHDSANLEIARRAIPNATFRSIDLNSPQKLDRQFDVVTCFETIEHVGSPTAALAQLLLMKKPGGTLLITVPIEVGIGGIIKFLVKRLVYGYTFDELPCGERGVWGYFVALLQGKRLSVFRSSSRKGWGTHFGFDWRDFEDILREAGAKFCASGGLFTRYIVIDGKGAA